MYFDYDPKKDRNWILMGRLALTIILSVIVYYLARTYWSLDEYEVYLFVVSATLVYYHIFAKIESGVCSVCKQEVVFQHSQEERYRHHGIEE